MKIAFVVLFAISAFAQDSASVLARILAEKGTITAAELARVEAAPPSDRVGALAALLQQKGLLSATEVARIAPAAPATQPAPPRTAESAAPAVTAQSRFPVTVYGTLLMNSVYDTALMNITDIPLFTGKQGADALGNDRSYSMTARQSRIGLKYESDREIMGAKLSGTVEVDFFGGKAPYGNGVDMDLLRLRLAYGRLDWHNFAIEAGQDWAIFAPLNPTSYAEFAIPSMSASGNPWIRLPQIRVEAHGSLSDNVSLLGQFAAMDPDMGDYNTAVFASTRPPGVGERGRAPAAEARFALTDKYDGRDFTIGVSGHYAHGKNAGIVGGIAEQLSLDSWGAAIDYNLPVTKKFALSGEAYTGRGLGIFSVTAGQAIEPVGVFGDRGVRARGGWAQAQFSFNPKWQVNAVYGVEDPNVRDILVGSRTRNQSYMGNVIYKYTAHALVAWEYRRILTDFRNQILSNERGNTVNLALAYIF